jgi:hypothetical protein
VLTLFYLRRPSIPKLANVVTGPSYFTRLEGKADPTGTGDIFQARGLHIIFKQRMYSDLTRGNDHL